MGISVRKSRGLTLENTIVTGALSTALAAGPKGAAGYRERNNVLVDDGTAHPLERRERTLDAYRTASGQGAGSGSFDPQLRSARRSRRTSRWQRRSAAREWRARSRRGRAGGGLRGAALRYCGAAPEPGAIELLVAAPVGGGSPGTVTPPPPTAGGPVPASGPAPSAVLPATGGEKAPRGAARRPARPRLVALRRTRAVLAIPALPAGTAYLLRGGARIARVHGGGRVSAKGLRPGVRYRFRIELVTPDGRRVSETLGVKTPRAARHAQPRPAR